MSVRNLIALIVFLGSFLLGNNSRAAEEDRSVRTADVGYVIAKAGCPSSSFALVRFSTGSTALNALELVKSYRHNQSASLRTAAHWPANHVFRIVSSHPVSVLTGSLRNIILFERLRL